MRCALCGRQMFTAAVTIGGMSIGPKCAQRAGLMEPARKRRGLLRLAGARMPRIRDDRRTMDLFGDDDG